MEAAATIRRERWYRKAASFVEFGSDQGSAYEPPEQLRKKIADVCKPRTLTKVRAPDGFAFPLIEPELARLTAGAEFLFSPPEQPSR